MILKETLDIIQKEIYRVDGKTVKINHNGLERNFGHFYHDEDAEEIQSVIERVQEVEINLKSIGGSLFEGTVGDH